MHPTRAASILALAGAVLLAAALALRLISVAQALALPPAGIPGENGGAAKTLPIMGSYRLSADGRQVYFLQSALASPLGEAVWWSIPVDGGMPVRAEPPQTNTFPFNVGWDAVFIQTGDSDTQINVSLRGERVITAAQSPEGGLLALSTRLASGRARLYLLDREGRLVWLGEEDAYIDLDWSPDGKTLAFIAPRGEVDQVFTVSTDGQNYRQLTSGPARKSSPRWSPDGAWIAYLATTTRASRTIGRATPSPAPLLLSPTITPMAGLSAPAAPQTDVYLISPTGGDPRRLTGTREEEHDLTWAQSSRGAELLYAERMGDSPHVSYLYAAALSPAQSSPQADAPEASIRRVYPPLAVDGMTCPAVIAAGETGTVQVHLSSSALVPLDLPIALTAQGQSLLPAQPASIREVITLLPGEARSLEWEAPAAAGRFTRISAEAQIDDAFPIASPRCTALNTWLGMPNLPFIAISLPAALLGVALCVPRLLQLRQEQVHGSGSSGRGFYRMAALILVDILMLVALIAQEISLGR